MSATTGLDRAGRLPEPSLLRLGRWRVLASGRGALVTVALLVCAVGIVFATLGSGPLPVSPAEVVDTVLRRTDEFDFVVLDIGLPRACVALLVGAGLGAAGALLQALTRNPLGSPDVVGFDSGAAAGALVAFLVIGVGERQQAAGFALLGGGIAALLVLLLSSGARDAGYRIILIGIGLGALLDSVSAYLLTRSTVRESMNATRWLVGSLNSSDWYDVAVAGLGLLVLLPAAGALGRQLRLVLLGPEVASALGVRLPLVTGGTLAVSVGLSAVAVLAAGPISFVALAAPQLAGRLVGLRRAPSVLASAAMGAALLTASDLIGSRAFGDTDLPVGVVTGGIGGVYLAWLLSREWRRRM
ncbi:MAG: iron chelate uptake ABC transporter family permease subunit [Micropruina sp.]|uniref:FecCD family ABC transporter permease n=1 Tax=Micropruina sp. TaxID=2737536 RepID=UPI0039E2DA47